MTFVSVGNFLKEGSQIFHNSWLEGISDSEGQSEIWRSPETVVFVISHYRYPILHLHRTQGILGLSVNIPRKIDGIASQPGMVDRYETGKLTVLTSVAKFPLRYCSLYFIC
jgi:hypothetical protein